MEVKEQSKTRCGNGKVTLRKSAENEGRRRCSKEGEERRKKMQENERGRGRTVVK